MIQTRHVTAQLVKQAGDGGFVSTKNIDVNGPKLTNKEQEEKAIVVKTVSVTTGDIDGLNMKSAQAAAQAVEKGIIDDAIAANKKAIQEKVRKAAAIKRKKDKT